MTKSDTKEDSHGASRRIEAVMEACSFGEWLRRKRKRRDLTQEQLAHKVGCSAATIRKLEAEERRPSAQIALLLAREFEVPESEQGAFLRFARGDWRAAPEERQGTSPGRTAGGVPRPRLPVPPNAIIGRQKELTLVCGSLADPAIRLLTLVGPPGIGKTRLSLEAAHAMLDAFRGGAFFVALASLNDPELVARTIKQTLGFVDNTGQSVLERLKEGIGAKQMLLVLDNAEHLIRECAHVVTELLQSCPALKILVTSREALRVPGEWLFPVPALAFPGEDHSAFADPARLSEFPALSLFAERARALRPDFVLNRETIGPVAEICTHLDGLPLAIELIAPRLRLMSPQALLAHMSDQFTLSADGQRAVPTRQKTLHNAIAWSYDLLTPEERRLLTHMSVFSGGFTLGAAETVFAEHASVLNLVASLSDKSLLQRSIDSSGEIRFSMLETIQHFSLQRLREAGEDQAVRDRFLAYFAELGDRAGREIHGPEQLRWLRVLYDDLGNYRAALEWAVSRQQTGVALRLLATLGWLWYLRGNHDGPLFWLDRIRSLPGIEAHLSSYAEVLEVIGRSREELGEEALARSAYEEMREIGQSLGAGGAVHVGTALTALGEIDVWAGKFDEGQALHEQALAVFENCGDVRGMARAMFGLCIVNYVRFDQSAAVRAWGEKSLTLFRRAGDLWGGARVMGYLALQAMREREFDRARLYAEERLILSQRLEDRLGIMGALHNLANLHRYEGDYDRAVALYEECLALAHEYDVPGLQLHAHDGLGMTALQQDNYAPAREHFVSSYYVGRRLGFDNAQDLLPALAALAAGTGDPKRAATLSGADQAITLSAGRDSVYPHFRAEYDRHLAIARRELGEVAFEAAAAEGQAMSHEEAVAYALGL